MRQLFVELDDCTDDDYESFLAWIEWNEFEWIEGGTEIVTFPDYPSAGVDYTNEFVLGLSFGVPTIGVYDGVAGKRSGFVDENLPKNWYML